jgi:hypothetical protein
LPLYRHKRAANEISRSQEGKRERERGGIFLFFLSSSGCSGGHSWTFSLYTSLSLFLSLSLSLSIYLSHSISLSLSLFLFPSLDVHMSKVAVSAATAGDWLGVPAETNQVPRNERRKEGHGRKSFCEEREREPPQKKKKKKKKKKPATIICRPNKMPRGDRTKRRSLIR